MTKKKVGRPTLFTPELVAQILKEISEGSTERGCFRVPGRPAWQNWCLFKRSASAEFHDQLARAEKDWCAVHEDLVQKIAMDDSKDVHEWEETIEGPKGVTIKRGATTDNTSVQRHKLQIETLQRIMKWKLPERYGDKVHSEITGKDGKELQAFAPVLNITIKKNE